jgi:hypothetical protein
MIGYLVLYPVLIQIMKEKMLPCKKLHCLKRNTDLAVRKLVNNPDFKIALRQPRVPTNPVYQVLNGLHVICKLLIFEETICQKFSSAHAIYIDQDQGSVYLSLFIMGMTITARESQYANTLTDYLSQS